MNDVSRALTIGNAAKLYEGSDLTATAIRRLVRSGEIPSQRVGPKYLVTVDAIERWIHGKAKPTIHEEV